jgi:hypothetical protein
MQNGYIFRITVMPSDVVYRTLSQINVLNLFAESGVAVCCSGRCQIILVGVL